MLAEKQTDAFIEELNFQMPNTLYIQCLICKYELSSCCVIYF